VQFRNQNCMSKHCMNLWTLTKEKAPQ
jgi:hypothetical protein